MKAYKQTVRKYYKYSYVAWTQPVLTSNTSSSEMTLTPSSQYDTSLYPAWKAFDNDNSSGWLTADGTGSGTLLVTFNYRLRINSITVRGWSNPNGYTRTITIYDSNNNVVGSTHTYNGNGIYTWEFSNPLLLKSIKFAVVGSGMWGCIGEIDISAQKETYVESTSSDYDFYEDVYVYQLPSEQYQETVTRTITYDNANGGTVSGSNFWTGTVVSDANWSWHTKTGTITYGSNQRAGTWTINYNAYRQSNSGLEMTVIINYADNTTETVYTKTDFPNDNTTHTYTGTIIATKPWKGYTIQMRAVMYNLAYSYSGIGPINYTTTSYTEVVTRTRFKAFNV